MNDFAARLDAAPTHVAYFSRTGRFCIIGQAYGEVVTETAEAITLRTPAPNGAAVDPLVVIPRADLLARKDNGGRLTRDEWDAIFAEHDHEQVR